MKKPSAVFLLIIGGAAAIALISTANLMLFARLAGVELILEVLLTAGAVFGMTRLRGVFEKHYGIFATRFGLLAFVPSAAAAGIFFIICSILNNAGNSDGSFSIFKGYPLLWQMTSAAAVVMGYFMLVLSIKDEKRSSERLEALLLILALIMAAVGICLYCLSLERDPKDIEGWGQLATGGFGIILIGIAILLAASGSAVILDRFCLSRKRKRQNKDEYK